MRVLPKLMGLVGVGAILLSSACQSDLSATPGDTEAIEGLLEEYLPRLALAYSNGNATVLEGYAAEKEIAGMNKRIRDLATESRMIWPTFKSVQVEEVAVWSYANAFVTTLEVWDLQVVALGTDTVLSEVYGQRNRVKYQLKRSDDSWLVLFRQIEATFD